MAYSTKDWDIVKAFYERGLSLAEIVARPEVNIKSRSQISRKAASEGWKKGLPRYMSRGIVHEPSILYLITADEFKGIYKIGITNDIHFRLRSMQTGCPFKLYALKTYQCENARGVEFSLHAFFKKKRIDGEWFRLNDIDVAYINEALSNG